MFVREFGSLSLGSRLKAISDTLYDSVDAVYAAQGAGLQARWFPLLRLLLDRGPAGVTDIAVALGQTHSAVSQLAARLAKEGLVERRSDEDDSRRSLLSLSPLGEERLFRMKPIWSAVRAAVDEAIARSGQDLMAAIAAFEAELDRAPLVDSIVRKHSQLLAAEVRVVPFAPSLREHFYRLNAEWLTKYFYIEEIDHRVLSNPEDEILRPGGAIFFAVLGDDVIGTCALKQESPKVYELTKMGVTERSQGLGVGRKLLAAAIAEFHQRKGRTLFLETQDKLKPALHLYESVGFVRQPGRRPDSHYARADVYMLYQPQPAAQPQENRRTRRPRSQRAARS